MTTESAGTVVHWAVICRCHRELWGPLCNPALHWEVPLIGSESHMNLITCRTCVGDLQKRGLEIAAPGGSS